MVSKARAKNVPGLVPKQMEILGREKRLENILYTNVLILQAHDYYTFKLLISLLRRLS
jgi:hypothetical protein